MSSRMQKDSGCLLHRAAGVAWVSEKIRISSCNLHVLYTFLFDICYIDIIQYIIGKET